jgi:hypothetical protein
MTRPEASLPILEPSVEVVTYQASTSARVDGVVSCEMIDSSMLRKGPKSPPVTLNTPVIAANSRIQKFSNNAKTIPLDIMSNEPASRTRRRPTLSATRVSNVPRNTSPRSVRVKKMPIWWSENCRAEKKIAIQNRQPVDS